MKNTDVRKYAKSKSVFLWMLAAELQISEPTMSRRLRLELPEQEKQRLFCLIDKIAERNAIEQTHIPQD